jgi:hypothetical protein
VFPDLKLDEWRSTRDSLHANAAILGAIRRAMTPPRKHWWHITLQASVRGLTTTTIPAGERALELVLNPFKQCIDVELSDGQSAALDLTGRSQATAMQRLLSVLQDVGVDVPELPLKDWDDTVLVYDRAAAMQFWQALTQIEAVFQEFKGGLRQETGPIHLFPHHFDLSVNWFSGRHIPGADPDDAENADEQMNFGFVTGDSSVRDAYFYVTAYPEPDGFTEFILPDGAYWHTDGFVAAVLPYEELAGDDQAGFRLLSFLRTVQQTGASLMR